MQLTEAQRTSTEQGCSITAASFGHLAQPDSRDVVEIIKDLPIPSPALLSDLTSLTNHSQWMSVQYAHLSPRHSASQSNFPLWLVTYWIEVAHLQSIIRRPWSIAESFLRKAQQTWKAPETRQLCDTVEIMLLQLPWFGETVGFDGNNKPTHTLACYLSTQWL